MNKIQAALKQRIDKAKEIYEAFQQKYANLSRVEQWTYPLRKHICAAIQTELLVSERKAKEYIKLIEKTNNH